MEILFPTPSRTAREIRRRIAVRTSPLHEALMALHALSRPSSHGALLPWALAVRPEIGAARLCSLREVAPILTGPLRSLDSRTDAGPARGFAAEIAWARHQPADLFAADVRQLRQRWTDLYDPRLGRHSEWDGMTPLRSPRLWAELEQRTDELRERLLDLVEGFWECCFRPVWQDIGPLLEEEASALRAGLAGAEPCAWLAGLSPRIHCDADAGALHCHVPWGERAVLRPDFQVIASPSVFVWPHLYVTADPGSARFTFPSRAVAAFASPVACSGEARVALSALGDASRLEVFRHLVGRPATNNALAHSLRITPSTVARHLAQLQAAGLVLRRQQGHYAFYEADPKAMEALAREIGEMRREVHPALERWLLRETAPPGVPHSRRESGALRRRVVGPESAG